MLWHPKRIYGMWLVWRPSQLAKLRASIPIALSTATVPIAAPIPLRKLGPACSSGWCHRQIPSPLLHKDMAIPVSTNMPAWMNAWIAQYYAPACLPNSMTVNASRLVGSFSKPTIIEAAAPSFAIPLKQRSGRKKRENRSLPNILASAENRKKDLFWREKGIFILYFFLKFGLVLTSRMHLRFSLLYMPNLISKGWKFYHTMRVQRDPIKKCGVHHHVGFSTSPLMYKELLFSMDPVRRLIKMNKG